ncbi:hypothetical protein JXR93_09340 [bacterium]|nr:hypothetical protein [bacterium]
MENIQFLIDKKSELLLKKIKNNHGSVYEFFTTFIHFWIEEELQAEGMTIEFEDYSEYYSRYNSVLKDYFEGVFDFENSILGLKKINKKLINKEAFRHKNLVHRHFLHEISDHKEISLKMETIFNNKNINLTILEEYSFLHYNLKQIYPFYTGLSIRLFTNLYLLEHQYFPFIPYSLIKADYYSLLNEPFEKFQEGFFELIVSFLDKLDSLS